MLHYRTRPPTGRPAAKGAILLALLMLVAIPAAPLRFTIVLMRAIGTRDAPALSRTPVGVDILDLP